LLPAPTAPSEGSAGVRNLVDKTLRPTYPLSILAHQLRRRFLSDRSLLRGARLIYSTTWPEGSLVVRPARPAIGPKSSVKTVRCSAALLGMTSSCVPLCSSTIRRSFRSRVARDENHLFRRLFPAGPETNPKVLPIACRRRSDLWSPAASSCRCRPSDEAGTAVPITHAPCTSLPSRGSEKCVLRPVDNGDIGNNRRNSVTNRDSRLIESLRTSPGTDQKREFRRAVLSSRRAPLPGPVSGAVVHRDRRACPSGYRSSPGTLHHWYRRGWSRTSNRNAVARSRRTHTLASRLRSSLRLCRPAPRTRAERQHASGSPSNGRSPDALSPLAFRSAPSR